MKKQSLYSESISTGSRSFYFDIKASKQETNYLTITSIAKKNDTTTDRYRLMIFENEVDQFSAAFMRSLLHFNRKTTTKNARIEKARTKYARAFEPWTKKEEAELALLYSEGKSIDAIGEKLERQPGAVKLRIDKMELVRS